MLRFKDFLKEGNPLARVHKFEKEGRSTAGITAWRAELPKSENKKRMKSFDKDLRDLGYGFRKTEGTWEGGKEESRFVTAKGKGKKAEHHFRRDMENLSNKYGQDAVAIRRKTKTILKGTNDTGYPGRGKVANVGRTVYNKSDAVFKTEFNPSRPAKERPTFTTKE